MFENSKKFKKMDKTLKSKWIKALLSGKYKQGKGCLKAHGRYCCLGVLADIQGKLGKNLHKDNFACSEFYLNGGSVDLFAERKLIDMNDGLEFGRKFSFKEIAEWIKKNL